MGGDATLSFQPIWGLPQSNDCALSIFAQNRQKNFSVNGPQLRFFVREGASGPRRFSSRGASSEGDVLQGDESATLRGGRSGRRCSALPFEGCSGAPGVLGSGEGRLRSHGRCGGRGWRAPGESAMCASRGHEMPLSDMAAPLLPRPAEELKMAAARKCGAERNARQRGKRRPSGNAARPAPPGPGLLPR